MNRRFCAAAATAAAAAALVALPAAAANLSVLHSFNGPRGKYPAGSLIADSAGNLYGTTTVGGVASDCGGIGCGIVFKLTPPAAGKSNWTETVLLNFNTRNGTYPTYNLIIDSAGNLYGTTYQGTGAQGVGIVFKLAPAPKGKVAWTETVLFKFGGSSGAGPSAGLTADAAGDLFGTTSAGGAANGGTVFELTPPAAGQTAWTETVLASFSGSNGLGPQAALLIDSAGNLYGTTAEGGATANCPQGCGTVFKLAPPAAGQTAWTQTVLFEFDGPDGEDPVAGLVADSAGNLYGTTKSGGDFGSGTAFKLAPPKAHQTAWTQKVLTSFRADHGENPEGTLIADGAGNLYGTAAFGGRHKGGVIFKLIPPAAGKTAWTETGLFDFNGGPAGIPLAGLLADSAGNLYGTTQLGGLRKKTACGSGCGAVFELKP